MKFNGATIVPAVAVASFLDTREGMMSMGAQAATRRQKIPARCVAEGCPAVPSELAVVDCLPGSAPMIFPLCEDHGKSEYEALWGVPEDD